MRTLRWIACGVALTLSVCASAQAQVAPDPVIARMERFGRMSHDAALDVAQAVSAQLIANARRGGDRYDRLRQKLGSRLFSGPNGGPGDTREEYRRRLARVLDSLSRGLGPDSLEAFFTPGPDLVAFCTEDFGLTMGACDALAAAASQREAATAYMSPDDGRALSRSLVASGVPLTDAEQIVASVRALVLGVPRSMSADDHGLRRLIEECPGALTSRESQLRAWHAGPTEGLARCLVRTIVGNRRDEESLRNVGARFHLSRVVTLAFARWATSDASSVAAPVQTAPAAAPAQAAVAPSPSSAPVDVAALLAEGDRAFAAHDYVAAEAAYRRVVTHDPNHGPGLARLGSALLRLSRGREAAETISSAIERLPRNAPRALAAGLFATLGDAYASFQDSPRASAAYRRALQIDRRNTVAADGLARIEQAERPAPTAVAPPNAEQLRARGRDAFRRRHFDDCIEFYTQASRVEATHAGTHAAIGACHLAKNEAAPAVTAYREAVRLDPNNAAFHAALGEACFKAERFEDARAAFRQALQLDSRNRVAQAGLRQLPEAPPQLPEQPSREHVMMVMRGLQLRIQQCMPTRSGVIRFKLAVVGETGMVESATVAGGDFAADIQTTSETDCALTVIQGASFPRFTRERVEFEYPYSFQAITPPAPVNEAPPAAAP